MKFLRVVQLGGAFFFVLVVVLAVLFAAGYQYDPAARGIVKKSVVIFEKLPAEASVRVNGEPVSFALSGELRLEPGSYDVEILRPPSRPWKKRIAVPEDAVVRFPEILLLPPVPAAFFETTRQPMEGFSLRSADGEGMFLENRNLHFGKWFPFDSPDGFFIVDLPPVTAARALAVVSRELLVGVRFDGKLFSYTPRRQPAALTLAETGGFLDVKALGGRLFALAADGKVWNVSPDTLEPVLFFDAAREAARLVAVQQSEEAFLFVVETAGPEKSQALFVTDGAGAVLFQQPGISAAALDPSGLWYALRSSQTAPPSGVAAGGSGTGRGPALVHYSVREKRVLDERPLAQPLVWMSRVGTTFHFLFLNDTGALDFCDEDGGNCERFVQDSALVASGGPFVSADRGMVTVPLAGQFIWFDFAARKSSLPVILKDWVSGVF